MARIHDAKLDVRMTPRERLGRRQRHYIIVHAVRHKRRLPEIRIVFKLDGIFYKLVAQGSIRFIGIVVEHTGTGAFPFGNLQWGKSISPPFRELKGRGEQDQPVHVGMSGRIQRR